MMALSAFDDRAKQPDPDEIAKSLRRTAVHWTDLIAHVAAEYSPLEQAWGFAGAKWGWSLRLKQKKRTVLYMTPCKGYFLVGFVLGEKAVRAAHKSRLSAATLVTIDEARKFAEGRGVRLEIRNKTAREQAKLLAAIKMAN